MRGKAYCVISCPLFQRITPAYAGKSTWKETFVLHIQDHPRLCGEKQDF